MVAGSGRNVEKVGGGGEQLKWFDNDYTILFIESIARRHDFSLFPSRFPFAIIPWYWGSCYRRSYANFPVTNWLIGFFFWRMNFTIKSVWLSPSSLPPLNCDAPANCVNRFSIAFSNRARCWSGTSMSSEQYRTKLYNNTRITIQWHEGRCSMICRLPTEWIYWKWKIDYCSRASCIWAAAASRSVVIEMAFAIIQMQMPILLLTPSSTESELWNGNWSICLMSHWSGNPESTLLQSEKADGKFECNETSSAAACCCDRSPQSASVLIYALSATPNQFGTPFSFNKCHKPSQHPVISLRFKDARTRIQSWAFKHAHWTQWYNVATPTRRSHEPAALHSIEHKG